MKKILIATLTAVTLGAGVSSLAIAKDGEYRQGHNPVERMAEKLQLSAEQQTQMQQLFDQQAELRKQNREQMHAQIDQILTEEQRTLHKQMQEQREQRWGGKHEHRKGDGERCEGKGGRH